MQVQDILTDDDAVSPVIGVILMVAITVILAAVIAAFVLGVGDKNEAAPNAAFTDEYNETEQEVQLRFKSGDTFNPVKVTFSGEDYGNSSTVEIGDTWAEVDPGSSGGDRVGSGDNVTIGDAESDYLIELVWNAEDDRTSTVIDVQTGPRRSGP